MTSIWELRCSCGAVIQGFRQFQATDANPDFDAGWQFGLKGAIYVLGTHVGCRVGKGSCYALTVEPLGLGVNSVTDLSDRQACITSAILPRLQKGCGCCVVGMPELNDTEGLSEIRNCHLRPGGSRKGADTLWDMPAIPLAIIATVVLQHFLKSKPPAYRAS